MILTNILSIRALIILTNNTYNYFYFFHNFNKSFIHYKIYKNP